MSKNPYDEMKGMTVAQIRQGLGAQALLFVGLGIALWWISGRAVESFINVNLYEIGLGLALGIGLIAVAAVIFRSFPRLSEKLVRLQSRNFAFLEKRFSMPMIVFVSICAGVGEEALFRAGLQTLLADHVPIALAITLSSIAFALIHFAKPLIAGLIFAIGALFGVAFWWTGSLLAVMIAHAVYDVYALWYLQEEMHRLNVFENAQDATEPEPLDEAPQAD